MERVLLAIDGIMPDEETFRYAVDFCRRIKAELNVLQIISPRNYKAYLKTARKGARRAKRIIEDSMMAVTFAEAGEHEIARDIWDQALENIEPLLTESKEAGISYQVSMKSGNPDKEIIDYVTDHRDIVLTIYDAPNEQKTTKKETGDVFNKIRKQLETPVVIMRS